MTECRQSLLAFVLQRQLSTIARRAAPFAVLAAACLASLPHARGAEHLPATQPLEWQGDLASRLVDGVDKFLLRKLDQSVARRAEFWQRDFTSPAKYEESIAANRQRLQHILGLRDERAAPPAMELMSTTSRSAEVGRGKNYRILRVRWQVLDGVHGEGLLLEPTAPVVAQVVAVPSAEQSPASLLGWEEGCPSEYARRLADSGCRVVIPTIVGRRVRDRRAELTDREFLYRSAFELGRHLVGYEIQKVLAAVDWFEQSGAPTEEAPAPPIGVVGWGDGGMLALYAAAVDPRIDAACVSGYFGPRESVWQEPLDRNVFGLLERFGDAELAALVAPRILVVDAAVGPEVELRTRGGAPFRLQTPAGSDVEDEARRAESLVGPLGWKIDLFGDSTMPGLSDEPLSRFLKSLAPSAVLAADLAGDEAARSQPDDVDETDEAAQERTIHEIDQFNQRLLVESPYVRRKFLERLDTSSLTAYTQSVESYREFFRDQVIGRFDDPLLPPNPRTRKVYDEPKWEGYEVVLDVYPDVFACGILLLPKDLQPDERRPVVVCQHGLEGRPRDTIEGDKPAYHDFTARLAERGFITFAPQNLYIFQDRFRTLQRKANPLGKTLFSVIVPQHQQITDWLSTLPQVDPERIGFYGLSYGGKSAMRIPPLVDRYCLSICSADFNDWVWKNASSRSPYSYVWTGEYEIFEWDLGSNFNYSEMAALIAPRPFMVERGHFDGVAPDERVALEFAKVRHLYQAKLGIGDRCEIEWFVGPHTINGKGTFDFLHRHLDWPSPTP